MHNLKKCHLAGKIVQVYIKKTTCIMAIRML